MGLFSRKKTVSEPPGVLPISTSTSNGASDPVHSPHHPNNRKYPLSSLPMRQESPIVVVSPALLLLPTSTDRDTSKSASRLTNHPSTGLEVPLRPSRTKPTRRSSDSSCLTPQSSVCSLAQSDATGDSYSDSGSEYEYEAHDHVVQPRAVPTSQLSALMGLCGILRPARTGSEEDVPRRTVSLLRPGAQIPRLGTDVRLTHAAIGERQVELIDTLRARLVQLHELDRNPGLQYAALEGHATLLDKYGILSEVVGRGAYGVIRMAGPANCARKNAAAADGAVTAKRTVYAVKELQQRPDGKSTELRDHFIDRVVSEFVLLLTFNSPHLVRTLDMLVTLPPQDASPDAAARLLRAGMKVSQVMEYTGGGDLLSYCQRCVASKEYLSIEEIDCMGKQIATGLQYMHHHGVAHCDVKLENVLIAYGDTQMQPGSRAAITLKLSDFGKSNVFRTKWDTTEQKWRSKDGPIGSEPYMAPEEHVLSKIGVSLPKKDSWGLGVVILSLFNLRQSYFRGRYGDYCLLKVHDAVHDESVQQTYPSTFLWESTAPKGKKSTFKDAIFAEYYANRMVADYSDATKEWTIRRLGTFVPIETLFDATTADERDMYNDDDFALRKYFIYKLLDVDAERRISTTEFLRGDWMADVQGCSK